MQASRCAHCCRTTEILQGDQDCLEHLGVTKTKNIWNNHLRSGFFPKNEVCKKNALNEFNHLLKLGLAQDVQEKIQTYSSKWWFYRRRTHKTMIWNKQKWNKLFEWIKSSVRIPMDQFNSKKGIRASWVFGLGRNWSLNSHRFGTKSSAHFFPPINSLPEIHFLLQTCTTTTLTSEPGGFSRGRTRVLACRAVVLLTIQSLLLLMEEIRLAS